MSAEVLNYATRKRQPLWLIGLRVFASLAAVWLFLQLIIARGHGALRLYQLMWWGPRWEMDILLTWGAVIVAVMGTPVWRWDVMAGVGHAGTALLLTAWVVLVEGPHGVMWSLEVPGTIGFLAMLGLRTGLCIYNGSHSSGSRISLRMIGAFFVVWLGVWVVAMLVSKWALRH